MNYCQYQRNQQSVLPGKTRPRNALLCIKWDGKLQIKSNQIKSTIDLVRLLQLERRRITLSRLVRSLELVTVGSPEEECFQAALESWCGTHQVEFCWQPIPCLRSCDGERPLTEFQTCPGDE